MLNVGAKKINTQIFLFLRKMPFTGRKGVENSGKFRPDKEAQSEGGTSGDAGK